MPELSRFGEISITSAKPLHDMMLLLTFSTGEKQLFDATVLQEPAFAPLSDEKIFRDCRVVDGVVTWMDEDIDCAPEYKGCKKDSDYPGMAQRSRFLHGTEFFPGAPGMVIYS